MYELTFTSDWNYKLHSKTYFTTIRKHDREKYRKGELLKVWFPNKECFFLARIEDVITKDLSEFNNYELSLDTGYGMEDAKRLIKSFSSKQVEKLDYILLKRIIG
jgi:hypothetical protein